MLPWLQKFQSHTTKHLRVVLVNMAILNLDLRSRDRQPRLLSASQHTAIAVVVTYWYDVFVKLNSSICNREIVV